MRQCKNCKEHKELDEFYGGKGRICKSCKRDRSLHYRQTNREKIADYDRERNKRSNRRMDRALYSSTEEGRLSHERSLRRWKNDNPHKVAAQEKVKEAVAYGRLQRPSECEGCGKEKTLQAHHYDYSKQLDVVWLCKRCHVKADNKRRMTDGT